MSTAKELFQKGVDCMGRGDSAGAQAACRDLLSDYPAEPEGHMLGGFMASRPELSLEHFRKAAAAAPGNAWVRYNLGVALQSLGRKQEAAEAFALALRLHPGYVEAMVAMASVCMNAGDLGRAEALCKDALGRQPGCGGAWNVLGHLRSRQGRLQESIDAFQKAVDCSPGNAYALNNLAAMHQQVGRNDLAMECHRRALQINPDYAESHSNLGILLCGRGEMDEAERHMRHAVRIMPTLAAAHMNLGGVLQARNRLAEAIECFRKADELAGGDPIAVSNLLLCMNYDPAATPAALYAEHVRFGQRFDRAANPGPAPGHDRSVDRPLRVGYVSADFRDHALCNFIVPVLESHDRARVTPICYSGVTAPDRRTETIRKLAGIWRDTHGVADAQLAQMIREDQVDILVDLAGHTGRGKLTLFAHRPAPVALTWLGYPNTTGLKSIQYCLADDIVDPPGAEAFFTESLYRLEGGFCCYRHLENDPGVSPLPAEGNGFVTFGSTHGLMRLNREVLETWAALMRAAPSARLLVFRNTLQGAPRTEMAEALAAAGIPAGRFELCHAIKGEVGYMRIYHAIDISLDSFPWSGHTTACQALWMGAPVVTLRGNRHAGRRVASVLHHARLGQWIADSREQYVQIAAGLASDIAALARIRASLRGQLAASPVCDAVGFTHRLEAAYRDMWRRWVETNV